jgi:hypothetical protein
MIVLLLILGVYTVMIIALTYIQYDYYKPISLLNIYPFRHLVVSTSLLLFLTILLFTSH